MALLDIDLGLVELYQPLSIKQHRLPAQAYLDSVQRRVSFNMRSHSQQLQRIGVIGSYLKSFISQIQNGVPVTTSIGYTVYLRTIAVRVTTLFHY
jgi:hypothetical protein